MSVQFSSVPLRRSARAFRSLKVQASDWARAVQYYRQLHDSGLPIVGVRYEDILADPESNMRRILSHCDLPQQLAVNSVHALKVGVWLFRPFAGSPPGLFAPRWFAPWLFRPLAYSPPVPGWFAFWFVRPLAFSPPHLGRFAPVEYR